MKTPLSQNNIKKMYLEGHRDFTNIACQEADFSSFDFRDADFTGSNLDGSRFRHADLNNTKFVNCSLNWCNFDFAKMKNTDFTAANLSWAKMTSPRFDKTIFRRADFSWALLFKANEEDADFTDAITGNIARTFSEMNEFSQLASEEDLKRSGLSANIMACIQRGVDKTKEKWMLLKGIFKPGAVASVSSNQNLGKYPGAQVQQQSHNTTTYGGDGSTIYNKPFSYEQRSLGDQKRDKRRITYR